LVSLLGLEWGPPRGRGWGPSRASGCPWGFIIISFPPPPPLSFCLFFFCFSPVLRIPPFMFSLFPLPSIPCFLQRGLPMLIDLYLPSFATQSPFICVSVRTDFDFHSVAGGCAHVFSSAGLSFDTGLHYIGRLRQMWLLLSLLFANNTSAAPLEFQQQGSLAHDNGGDRCFDEICIGKYPPQRFRPKAAVFLGDLINRFPKEVGLGRLCLNILCAKVCARVRMSLRRFNFPSRAYALLAAPFSYRSFPFPWPLVVVLLAVGGHRRATFVAGGRCARAWSITWAQ
jgi:hypothetical protein